MTKYFLIVAFIKAMCTAQLAWAGAPPEPDQGTALAAQFVAAQKAGDFGKALALARARVEFYQRTPAYTQKQLSDAIMDMGIASRGLGRYDDAIMHYQRVEAMQAGLAEVSMEERANLFNNIGLVYVVKDMPQQGIAYIERAIAILDQHYNGKSARLPTFLNNLSIAHRNCGNYAAALSIGKRALAARREYGGANNADYALSLNSLANFYGDVGEDHHAYQLFEQAYKLRIRVLGAAAPVTVSALCNMANSQRKQGNLEVAAELYPQCVSGFEQALGPEHFDLSSALGGWGTLLRVQGQLPRAVEVLQRAIAIRSKALGNWQADLAVPQTELALALRAQGNDADATKQLRQGLLVAAANVQPEYESNVLQQLAAGLVREHPAAAVFFAKRAINLNQRMRSNLGRADETLRRSFRNKKVAAYRDLAGYLIDQARTPEAQEIMALMKEEEYLDYMQAGATGSGIEASYSDEEARLAQQFDALSEQLRQRRAALADSKAMAQRSTDAGLQANAVAAEANLAGTATAYQGLLDQTLSILDQPRASRYAGPPAALLRLAGHRAMLTDLTHGAVTVQYLLGNDALRIVLTTPSAQVARKVAITASGLRAKITAFRQQVQDPNTAPLALAQELHRLLIAPVRAELAAPGVRTLIMSLDGDLRHVPLAALHNGKHFLVEDYRLVLATEAAPSWLKQAPSAQPSVAAMGLTQEVAGHRALPGVQRELEGIVQQGQRGVLPGTIDLNQDFNAARVAQALKSGHPYIHLASHFVFRSGADGDSFLLLGDGNTLNARELAQPDYDFSSVELLTLSACNTAIGGKDEGGREFEALGVLLQKQGARGILATLWSIDDGSTSVFMPAFYRKLAQHANKADALRYAQLEFLHWKIDNPGSMGTAGPIRGVRRLASKNAAITTSAAAPYAHPYYWAPFVMMGSWL